MFCEYHKERLAIGQCMKCGCAICADCESTRHGIRYCRQCAGKQTPLEKKEKHRNPFIAAILAFLFPGTGQIYNGQIGKGVFIFLTCWLIIPWIYGIFDAYTFAVRLRNQNTSLRNRRDFLLNL